MMMGKAHQVLKMPPAMKAMAVVVVVMTMTIIILCWFWCHDIWMWWWVMVVVIKMVVAVMMMMKIMMMMVIGLFCVDSWLGGTADEGERASSSTRETSGRGTKERRYVVVYCFYYRLHIYGVGGCVSVREKRGENQIQTEIFLMLVYAAK